MTDRLPAFEGLDTEIGLEATGGDSALYLRLLGRFGDIHSRDGDAWPAMLAAGDIDQAVRQVHRLRGAAATLGLVQLAKSAAQFEEALREQGPSPSAIMQMVGAQVELGATVRALQAALPTGGPTK